MSLQDDLKAKTLTLISQQMANWVVDIQRQIGEHQGNLVRALDELQENVARYDEKINEADIEMAVAETLAAAPPPPAAGPGFDRLRAAIAEIEHGSNLSEVLTALVNEASHHVDRVAMFIVKGTNVIGWYARGVNPPEAVKHVNVPLAADTFFHRAQTTRAAVRGMPADSPGTVQAMTRMGGMLASVLVVPLILRDKLAAVLYCDSAKPEIPAADADLIEILVLFASKTIDLLSLAPKPAAAAAPAPRPTAPPAPRPTAPPAPAVAPHHGEGAGTVMFSGAQAAQLRQATGATPPPAKPAPSPADEGSSTVMFSASQFQAIREQAVPAPAPPPPPRPAAPAIPPEQQKAHDDAKRFARLVVSEIKLYNENKVAEGRKAKDIYERLKEDIERGRQMYQDRVPAAVRDQTNYFYDELVRILAGGDAGVLGPM
jgi:hypothetical protein